MPQNLPEVRFTLDMGRPIFPRPLIKQAVLVPIPQTADGSDLPTIISPEWGGLQVFYGSYYAIIHDGVVIYGSARDQWEAMHTRLRPGHWVKTAIPTAYMAKQECRIVTLIPNGDSDVRETSNVVEPGDYIVRQPGGEIQRVTASKFEEIYFSDDEATTLGLTLMSVDEFTIWAVTEVSDIDANL